MSTLRALFLSLLCLAVLPWGAFARHVSAPGPATVVAAPAVHRAERPCRVAALTSSTCAPEAVLARAGVAAMAPGAVIAPPRNARLDDLWWPQRPLDPPESDG